MSAKPEQPGQCPFCGATDPDVIVVDCRVIDTEDREYRVWCRACGAYGPDALSNTAALTAWAAGRMRND